MVECNEINAYINTVIIPDLCFYFKRNTPQLAANGIKGIRIQLRDRSDDRVPFLCGGALHAPSACSGVRRRRLTAAGRLRFQTKPIMNDIKKLSRTNAKRH